MGKCAVCQKDGVAYRCSRCSQTTYCSKVCQSVHWKRGHKKFCRIKSTEVLAQYHHLVPTLDKPDYDYVQELTTTCIKACESMMVCDTTDIARIVNRCTLLYFSPFVLIFDVVESTFDQNKIAAAINRLPETLRLAATDVVSKLGSEQQLWRINYSKGPLVRRNWSCIDKWSTSNLRAVLSVQQCTAASIILSSVYDHFGIQHAIICGVRLHPKFNPMLSWIVDTFQEDPPMTQLKVVIFQIIVVLAIMFERAYDLCDRNSSSTTSNHATGWSTCFTTASLTSPKLSGTPSAMLPPTRGCRIAWKARSTRCLREIERQLRDGSIRACQVLWVRRRRLPIYGVQS